MTHRWRAPSHKHKIVEHISLYVFCEDLAFEEKFRFKIMQCTPAAQGGAAGIRAARHAASKE